MKRFQMMYLFLLLAVLPWQNVKAQTEPVSKHGIFEFALPPGWSIDDRDDDELFIINYKSNNKLMHLVFLNNVSFPCENEADFWENIDEIKDMYLYDLEYKIDYEGWSDYKFLGADRIYMMSYKSSLNIRNYLFTPVVDGRIYLIDASGLPDIPKSNKPLKEEVFNFLSGIYPAGKRPAKAPDATVIASSGDLNVTEEIIPEAPAMPYLDINKVTAAQWDGAVSAAMEGMRMVYGPMTDSEESEFLKTWAPLRQTPFKEAVDYLNKFNPLLGEFLLYRSAVVQAGQLLEESVAAAGMAAEYDDPIGVKTYTDQASRYRSLLVSRQKHLQKISDQLVALGNPPDGRELMEQKQKRYKEAKEFINSSEKEEFSPEGCWESSTTYFPHQFGGYSTHFYYIYKVNTNRGERYQVIDLSEKWIEPDYKDWKIMVYNHKEEGDHMVRYEIKGPFEHYSDEDEEIYQIQFDCSRVSSVFEKHYEKLKSELHEITGDSYDENKARERLIRNIAITNYMENFFKTAERWTKEGIWENFDHNWNYVDDKDYEFENMGVYFTGPETEDLRMAFLSEMEGNKITAKSTGKVEPKKDSKISTTSPAGPNSLHIADDKTAEERKAIDNETIQFHQNNIAIIESHLAKDREELAKEKDPARIDALNYRILNAQADIQAEKDRIATIKTGEIVHTRSAWDDYVHTGFIQNIAENQQKMDEISRSIRKAYENADRLPADEARKAREILNTKLRGDMLAGKDAAAVDKIVDEANNVGKQYYEKRMAEDIKKGEEAASEAEWYDAFLQTAELTKKGADGTMMVMSLFGGRPVNLAYQGITGYLDGGPREVFLRVSSTYNMATGAAVDAFRGFENAVNEGGDFIDGFKGAGYEAAKGYITTKALSFGAARLSSSMSNPQGKFSDLEISGNGKFGKTKITNGSPLKMKADDFNRPPTAAEMKVYRDQIADGRTKVTSFRKTYEKLEQARKSGASTTEMKSIIIELDDRAAKIHSSPQAKMMMKTLQKDSKNLDMIKRYSNSMDRVHQKVEKNFHQEMERRGWSKEEMAAIRNRPDPKDLQLARERQAQGLPVDPEDLLGSKTVNMDYDIGIMMKRAPNGQPIPPQKNGQRASIEAWHTEAQQVWDAAYQAQTGQSAPMSWENVTHSKLADAYADLNVLQKNGILHADKAWAGQTADVTYFKGAHLSQSPEFGKVEKLVEISRGNAKDYRTKMKPLIESKKPKTGGAAMENWQENKTYWDTLYDVMERMGSGKLDPMKADREIRQITGGKSLLEVSSDMRNMMEAMIKL